MKMKSINKILTSVLSLSMLLGSAMPVLAAEGGVDVEAPIYSLDVIDVIVPTTYAVAFNPDGLTVKTGTTVSGGDAVAVNSTEQILSKNYGIINKSSKDKLITITLNVVDQNTNSGITFVNSAQDVSDAEAGEYKIHLTVIPADTNEVTVGSASADESTTAADLNDVTMTPVAAGKEVTLGSGENYIGFKLSKAVWTPKDGSELTLGGTSSNDVRENFEVTGLADSGKGITAFTFGGEMNANADWSKLTQGIKITVIYGNETISSNLATIDGTGAMVKLNIAPTFTTGNGIGQIKYSRGTGDDGLKQIKKVDMNTGSKVVDGYNAGGTYWPAATDEAGVVTLSSQYLSFFTGGTTIEATVTYETNSGDTKTAKVDVFRESPNVAPTFTTGAGIGQINYTPGIGDDGLKEIKKIEMNTDGKVVDGYNAGGTYWDAATDAAGVITFDSRFMTYFTAATVEATVTYETNSGETRTASLDVKCK